MTSASRKQRSRETEAVVAERLQEVFPGAARIPASLPGNDILNTPGHAIECKARRDLRLVEWLRQVGRRAKDDELPVVIHRPDGFGPATVDDWPVTMPMWAYIELLKRERKQ